MYIRPTYWKLNNGIIELFGRTENKSVYVTFKQRHVSLVDVKNYRSITAKKQESEGTYVIQDNTSQGIVDPLGLLASFFWISDIQPYDNLKLNRLIPIKHDTNVRADLHFEAGSLTAINGSHIDTVVASFSVYRDIDKHILNIAMIVLYGNRMHQFMFHINNEIQDVNPKTHIYIEDSEYNCVKRFLFVMADSNPDRIITKDDDLNIIADIILNGKRLNDVPSLGKLNLPGDIYEVDKKLTLHFPGVDIININQLMSRLYPQFGVDWTLRMYVRTMFPFKEVDIKYPAIDSNRDVVGIGLMSQAMLLNALYLQELWGLLETYTQSVCNRLSCTIESLIHDSPEHLIAGMMFAINPVSILRRYESSNITTVSIPKGIYHNVYCLDLTHKYLEQFDTNDATSAIAKQKLEDITFLIPIAWRSGYIRKLDNVDPLFDLRFSSKMIGRSLMFLYSLNYTKLPLANEYKILISDGKHMLAIDTLNNIICDIPNICSNSNYVAQVLDIMLGSSGTLMVNNPQDEVVNKWIMEITS